MVHGVYCWLLLPAISQAIDVVNPLAGELITELHQLCSPEQGEQARCGSGATCLLLGGVPTCHCIRDIATGAPMAGNPYRGCTWDLSGKWEMMYLDGHSERLYYDGVRNEPYIISIQRTDAVLKTRYITGTIFVITPVTSVSNGLFQRAFLDVNDNRSVILELAEGFVDQFGRNMYFKNRQIQHSLTKVYPSRPFMSDQYNLEGGWVRQDGGRVKIHDFHRLDSSVNNYGGAGGMGTYSLTISPGFAYWYNDDAHAIPQMRLSTTIFMDETLPFEQAAFDTTSRFVQVGMFGEVSLGGGYMIIKSPADGRPIFSFRKVMEYPIPTVTPPASKVISISGMNQVSAVSDAANNAILVSTTPAPVPVTLPYHLPQYPDNMDNNNGWMGRGTGQPDNLNQMYPSYGLFNRGINPNNTYASDLTEQNVGSRNTLDPNLEIDPYAFSDGLVGPPTSYHDKGSPNSNIYDSRREGGTKQSSIFYRGLTNDADQLLETHEKLRRDELVFNGLERMKDMFDEADAARRLLAGKQEGFSFEYPSPSSEALCRTIGDPLDLIAPYNGTMKRQLVEMTAQEFLVKAGASSNEKVAVGIVDLSDFDEKPSKERRLEIDYSSTHNNVRTSEASKNVRASEAVRSALPKTTLNDLKKLIPSQITENPITQLASKAWDNKHNPVPESATSGIFDSSDFFGLEIKESSPYDWLWKASARRLSSSERMRDEILMRKVGKRAARGK